MTSAIAAAVADIVTIGFLFVALVFTAGIVWRVEKRLDLSYKLFLVALSLLLFGEISGKFFMESAALAAALSGVKALSAFLLLLGMWEMRRIVRELDGERKSDV